MDYSRIGVFATVGTIKSEAYKKELQKYNPEIKVFEVACPNWVSIVEGFIDDGEDDIKKHFNEIMLYNPDKIILGCTHYPYLLESLSKLTDKEMFIDPAIIFVEYIAENILKNDIGKNGTEEFFVSASPELFVKNAQLFYNVTTLPTLIDTDIF